MSGERVVLLLALRCRMCQGAFIPGQAEQRTCRSCLIARAEKRASGDENRSAWWRAWQRRRIAGIAEREDVEL